MSTAETRDSGISGVLRRHAEQQFAGELDELKNCWHNRMDHLKG